MSKLKKWYVRFLMQSGIKDMNEDIAKAEADIVSELLPENEVITDLHKSEYCKFCKNDNKIRKADGYATTDIGNESPTERTTGAFKNKGGTVLPITLPICSHCRRNFRLVQFLPTVISVVIEAVALILICNNRLSIRSKIIESNVIFAPDLMKPFFVFAITTALVVLFNFGFRRLLIKNLNTNFNIFKVCEIAEMQNQGWFKLHGSKHCCDFMFSKNIPEYLKEEANTDECGCTGSEPEDTACDCHKDKSGEENACDCHEHRAEETACDCHGDEADASDIENNSKDE